MDVSIFEKSIRLHEEFMGKLEVRSKVSLETIEDLFHAYTPGVPQAFR